MAKRKGLLLLLVVLLGALPASARKAAIPKKDRPMLIVDTDAMFWGDDLNCILLLLRSKQVQVVGITTVSGNVWGEQVTANVLRVLENTGNSGVPVYPGPPSRTMEERLRYFVEVEKNQWAKGNWVGALAQGPPIPPAEAPPGGWSRLRPAAKPAADFMVETILANPGKVSILELGPPTNLAAALKKEPRIASLVKQVYVFGGAFDSGNSTATAEFNFWFDPESSDEIFKANLPLTLVPLDASRDQFYVDKLQKKITHAQNPSARHIAETIQWRLTHRPIKIVAMWDDLVAAVVLEPSVVKEAKQEQVEVIVKRGPDYGASRVVQGGAARRPVTVIYKLDAPAVERLFGKLLSD